jgi:hypothetical protein
VRGGDRKRKRKRECESETVRQKARKRESQRGTEEVTREYTKVRIGCVYKCKSDGCACGRIPKITIISLLISNNL